MKRINIACCILLILAANILASQSRVEGMGKRPAFFLDDATIFDNPANVTFYSNALIGELGFYNQNNLGPNDVGKQKDPFFPWFGALFKYELQKDNELRDPQVTIGGFFGREHHEFTRFVPRKVIVSGDTVPIPLSVTNFDAFLAGTMLDGSAVGAHVYVAIQDGKQDAPGGNPAEGTIASNAHVSILSMDYGANFLISNVSSVELTMGIARIQYGPSRKTFLDPGLFSFYSQGRLFLEMNAWSGQLVTGYKWASMEVPGWREKLYNINVGMNVMIPHGLFWIGLDGVLVKESVDAWDRIVEADDSYLIYRESREPQPEDWRDGIGGILSFGIERNVWGNWIVLRAGAQKSFIYQTCGNKSGKEETAPLCAIPAGSNANYWTTNPWGDGSLNDHIGFGVGLNFENKLKIDATIAEDLLFRNPFIGGSNFISRISAMYSF